VPQLMKVMQPSLTHTNDQVKVSKTKRTLPVSTFSSRQLAELNALDGAAIPKTVTAVFEAAAKMVTPSESENIVISLDAHGADSSGPASELCINELLSFVGFYRNKSNVAALCVIFFHSERHLLSEEVVVFEVCNEIRTMSIFGGEA